MKKQLLYLLAGMAISVPAISQEEPDWVVDPIWMEYFDEAYSVYLDGTNRVAGIKGLITDETETMWKAAKPTQDVISINDGVLKIEHTLVDDHSNWNDISFLTTSWNDELVYRFEHEGEMAGEVVDTLGGMFVDASLSGAVTVSFMAKTDVDCQIRLDLVDANGRQGNGMLQAPYQNTQRFDLQAGDWTLIQFEWNYEMFDLYSGAYWGYNTGMWDNRGVVQNGTRYPDESYGPEGTYLWAYDSYGDIIKHEIAQEDPIPVSSNALCKLMFIIDDGTQGYIGETKIIEIKDLVFGDPENAVDFIPFTDENIASGAIEYNPDNAVLVRALEEMDWKTGPLGTVSAPKVSGAIADVSLLGGFGVKTIVLSDYFSGAGSQSYIYNFDASTEGVSLSVDGDVLYISEVGGANDTVRVEVYAMDASSGQAVSTNFRLSYDATVNTPPYIKGSVSDITLEAGFVSHSVDLNSIFADAQNDALSYNAQAFSLNASAGSVTALLTGSKLNLNELALGTSLISVTATDGVNDPVSAVFKASVLAAGNTMPVPQSQMVAVSIGTSSAGTIDLADYISDADGDKLTYSIGGYALKAGQINGSILSVDKANAGMQEYSIIADDSKGGQVVFTVLAFVDAGDASPVSLSAPVADLSADMNSENVVDLSDKFASSAALDYYVSVSDANIAKVSEKNGMLTIQVIGDGSAEITVVAYDENGGFLTESFAVTSGATVVAEPDKVSEIALYPNIATEYIIVTGAKGEMLNVYSIGGSLVLQQVLALTNETVSVSQLATGTYIVSVGAEKFTLMKQ